MRANLVEQFPEQRAPRDGAPAPTLRPALAIVIGDGQFGMQAVGTAHHQDELEVIAGGRTEAGADILRGALLVPEPKNPHDPGAVAVVISSQVIGYLQSDVAPSLKEALRAGAFVGAGCAAKIVGRWERADGARGDFGVWLDAYVPFRLQSIAKQAVKNAPAPLLVVRESDSLEPPGARQIEPHSFGDRGVVPEAVAPPPRRRRSAASAILDLVLIAAILAGGYWWVQRLPREPVNVVAPAPVSAPAALEAAPAEPAPPPEPVAPSPVLAPWPAVPPPTPAVEPAATEPPAAPPDMPANAPIPRRRPTPAEKAQARAKQAAPKAAPATAPLKLN